METVEDKNTSDTNEPEDEYGPEYAVSEVGVYTLLICGIILTGIGIYVTLFFKGSKIAPAFQEESGGDAYISGPFYILLGVICSIYPVYRLIRQQFTKK